MVGSTAISDNIRDIYALLHPSNTCQIVPYLSPTFLFFSFLIPLRILGQCVAVEEPPELSEKTAAVADDDAVWDIPIVVHVLYGNEGDSIAADILRSMFLDSVNADFRRQNWDTVHTQISYLPISVDTRIQFHFATTDTDGQPTEGVTYRQTDGSGFLFQGLSMMYDSTGGREPWDVCRYLNIYVCRYTGGQPYVESSYPWTTSDRKGIIARPSIFDEAMDYPYYQHLTHFFGHFLGLRDYRTSPQHCEDTDSVEDTPIQSSLPALDLSNPDSIYPETNCEPIPQGRLGCNFMMATDAWRLQYMNMFTQGQKMRMRHMISDYYPGFIDRSQCPSWTGLSTDKKEKFTVHPNPATSILRFDSPLSTSYTVTDAVGKPVMQGQAQQGQNTLNMQNLPDGIYILRLEDGSGAARFVRGAL